MGAALRTARVAVVGGGVIGLTTAWAVARAGLASVTVYDPQLVDDAPVQASWVAAGMLAPITEVHYGEETLLALTLAARDRWPAFATELTDASGIDVAYRDEGTLSIARDADDLAALNELAVFQDKLGLRVERLTSREARRLEPALAPTIRGGFLAEDDHSVDPRRTVRALRTACQRCGVELAAEPIADLAELPRPADVVVLAAGADSRRLAPELPVRPVKGQVVHLQALTEPPLTSRTVRGIDVYLVPRADGRLVAGATVEERGADRSVTAGAVHDLLRATYELLPGMTELAFVEAIAGLRPGTPDNAPLLGWLDERRLAATGHYRNGVLLAPLTAELVVEFLRAGQSGEVPPLARPFAPGRFT